MKTMTNTFIGKNIKIKRGTVNVRPVPDADVITPNVILGLKLFNYSTSTIVVHTRMGTAVVLEPSKKNLSGGILMVRNYAMTFDKSTPSTLGGSNRGITIPGNSPAIYTFNSGQTYTEKVSGRSTIKSTFRLDVDLGEESINDNVVDKLVSYFNNDVKDNATHAVDEILYINDLSTETGIYLPDSDIVVSLGPEINPSISHPYFSVANTNNYCAMMEEANSNTSYNPVIKLVDNNSELGGKYALFNGDIIYLEPIRDPSLDDGLHLFGFRGNSNEHKLDKYDVTYYNPTDMYNDENVVRVYDSQRQAREALYAKNDNGIENANIIREHDKTILQLKQKLAEDTLTIKLAAEKRSNEIEAARHARTLAEDESKRKITAMEDELARVKQLYAESSMGMKHRADRDKYDVESKKSEVETWKVVGAGIAAGALIVGLLMRK